MPFKARICSAISSLWRMISSYIAPFPQRSRSFFFFFDQEVDTVEGHAAVVTDDTSAAVGIRKTGYDMAVAGSFHLRCVSVKDCLIVCLVVLREDLVELLIYLISVKFRQLPQPS